MSDRDVPQADDGLPQMIVVAGPNGSGKSTLLSGLMHDDSFPANYINADDIARTEFQHIADAGQRNKVAADLAEKRRIDAIQSGQPFAFETVLSTPGKLALISEAQAKGYAVELVFVTTESPEINIARVQQRAALGGHSVDGDKVRERYERAMNLMPSAVEMSNTADVFDNSALGIGPLQVAQKRDKGLEMLNQGVAPTWATERLERPIAAREASRNNLTAAAAELGLNVKPADIRHGKTHIGKIVDTTEHHVLQKVGANVAVLHDRAVMPAVALERGKSMSIAYQYDPGGKHAPQLGHQAGRDRNKGVGR